MNDPEIAIADGHERVLLSAMMNGAQDLPVSADDFSSPPNRMIFERMSGLSDRCPLAVQDALQRTGELDKVGGVPRITEIATMTHDEQVLNYSLEQVLERSRVRQRKEFAQQFLKDAITFDELTVGLSKLNQSSDGLPPMDDAAELVARTADLPPDVVEGILHRGAKMVLGGGSKTFKTWTLIDLAISVASGTSWLGNFLTMLGRVLYINLELQGAFFTERLQAVCDKNQVKLEPGYLTLWNLRGKAADLSKLLPMLLRQIGRDKYALIIIDPIYKLLGTKRDENKAGDIASLLNEVEKLAVETGAAVAFGAHYSKGNQAAKDVIDRIGGSGVFARDPDSILNFTRHEEQDCFTVDATLRNHPPVKPFVVRWEYPLMCIDSLLDPDQLKQAGAAVKQYHSTDLLDLLVRPMSTGEFKETAKTETGMSERTFYRLYGELKTSETLTLDAEGKWNRK
jgi:RecA-family ATPase